MCVVGGRPPPLVDLTEVTEVTEEILPSPKKVRTRQRSPLQAMPHPNSRLSATANRPSTPRGEYF